MADTLNVYREQGDLTPPSGTGGGKVALAILGLCAALGILGFFYLGGMEQPPAAPPDAGPPPPPPKPTLPSPSETDPRVRELLSAASPDPAWKTYLEQTDLVRVFVAATHNVSEGESPRTRLFFLAPAGGFEVSEKTDRRKKTTTTTVSPKSHARYDGVTALIGSLDEKIVASAFVALRDWFGLAYEEIGPRNRTFDSAWKAAMDRLIQAPVAPADAKLIAKGGVWTYEDPALEGLSAAEKHLLRFGPKNQQLVQAKLKAISEAVQASVGAAGADGGTAVPAVGGSSVDGGGATGDAGQGVGAAAGADAGS